MAHLAAGPDIAFSVQVETGSRLGEQFRPRMNTVSEQVDHLGIAVPGRVCKR